MKSRDPLCAAAVYRSEWNYCMLQVTCYGSVSAPGYNKYISKKCEFCPFSLAFMPQVFFVNAEFYLFIFELTITVKLFDVHKLCGFSIHSCQIENAPIKKI